MDVWDDFPDGIEAAAPRTGPFPHRGFLEAAERHGRGAAIDLVAVAGAAAGMMVAIDDDIVRFAGDPSLTDYHSPLGVNAEALASAMTGLRGHRFSFDSMPREACDVVHRALDSLGADHACAQDEVTAVLDLPDSHDGWLASLGKKERHEVRRKHRRFVAEFGDVHIVRAGLEAHEAFCAMHRQSAGDKGTFMSDEMEAFFGDLIVDAGACIHQLVCEGTVRAAAFGFETRDGYYYYNSAYDPDAALASPGVVLLSTLIEIQISRGATIFDFLKGDEPYKYRHGATRRPLFTIEGTLA